MNSFSRWALRSVMGAGAMMAICAAPAAAQIAAGDISGLVKDANGVGVPGVTITVRDVATNRARVVVSNADGAYAATGLAPAIYAIDLQLKGFRAIRRDQVRLSTGEKLRLDFDLAPGDVRQEVTVTGDVPALRAESGSLGTVINHDQVVGLPLNGRSFVTLTSLAPGVALPPQQQLPRINGGRPRTNEYLYDGISVLQPEPGQVAYFPIIDAIEEFRVEGNSPPAEFGRFNGGVVNLITKSGTNAFRGTGFEFFRNEGLNGTNYFQRNDPVKPDYRRNQFGGMLGGPLVKDRTFFFVDYQGQRQAIGRTMISNVPTDLQRQGIFTEAIAGKMPVIYDPSTTVGSSRLPFAGNQIPMAQMDAVALALLQRYPRATSAGTANNYRRTANEVDNQDLWDARLDNRLGPHDQAFARLTSLGAQFLPVTPLPEGSGVTAGTLGPQDTQAWSFASNYQHTFSSDMLNEVRVGNTSRTVDRSAVELPATAGETIPGIPSFAQFPNTLPTILIGGVQQLGSPANTASNFHTSVTEVADTLTRLMGRHTIKMGMDWRWERLDVLQPPSPTGAFTFTTFGSDLPGVTGTGTPLASFLLGQVQNFSIDLQTSQIKERAHFQEYFVQDDWKLTDRLTVNAGLRYTLNFPSTEVDGQTAVFNLDTQQLEYPGSDPVRPLKKDNFGPRLAGAYRFNDETIVSAGYGLVWIEMAGITTPFTTPTFPFLQTVSQRALDNVSPAFVLAQGPTVAPLAPTPDAGLGQGVFAVNAGLGSGYVQQWNVAFQRQLPFKTTVEIAYRGSIITNVGIPDSNINQLTVDQLAQGKTLLDRVPNPYFGIIPRSSSLGDPTITRAQLMKPYPEFTAVSLYRNNVGTTRYDGLSIGLQRRWSDGVAFSVAYTRSKLVDDASSVFDASILTGPVLNAPRADSFNLGLERDYSTGDIPNVFVSSVTWDLPWGSSRRYHPGGVTGAVINDWTVTGFITVQSGVPVAVTQVTNNNAFAGFGVQRPNLNGDPTLPADQRSSDRWFNTDAFSAAPQFTLGTASRNPVRGPGYRNVDLAVTRRLPVTSHQSLEVRVEVFNLLNTVQLGAPVSVLGAANFGSIITAFDPRVIQLALKFQF